MNGLAMQTAFIVPLMLPVVLALTSLRPGLFYPAMMIVLGAHYLPFVFLYGMWQFGGLSAVLIVAGVLLGRHPLGSASSSASLTGLCLLVFAFIGRFVAQDRSRRKVTSQD